MVDLILFNSNVITMNPAFPMAQLIAIRDGEILAVTGNSQLKELRQKNTKVVNCFGKTILPGFIDAHCHLHALAESFVTLNMEPCNNARSIPEIQK